MISPTRLFLIWLARRIMGPRVSGAPVEPRQRIYCANHASHLDALLLVAALPNPLRRHTRPVAAADFWGQDIFRRYLAQVVFRAILLERQSDSLHPLADVFAALRRGDSIVFFPEGTRGPGNGVQPLKGGIHYLARAFPNVEIVPVYIAGSHRLLPKGAFVPKPVPCSVTFGEPLAGQPGEEAPAFLERLRRAIEQLGRSA